MKLSVLEARIVEAKAAFELVKQVKGLDREQVLFDDDPEVVGFDGAEEWDIDFVLVYDNDEGVRWLTTKASCDLEAVLLQELEPGWKARVYMQVPMAGEPALPDIVPEEA